MRLVSFLLLPFLIASVFGQDPGNTGAVRLEVRDQTGKPLEATVVLHQPGTGYEHRIRTDSQGVCEFTKLAFGSYRIDVSRSGFASQSITIDLTSTATLARVVALDVGHLAANVTVVATTPLQGLDLAASEIPASIQSASADDLQRSGALDISDLLNRRLNGVTVNEVQGNPLQPDVNYRGYSASPLLGTPQGLSVYLDGVRLNQPLGDIVSWDLIPRNAISEATLLPGSNPLFGLNSLGGALAVQTRDGRSQPGTAIRFNGGSFGRLGTEFEHGGQTAHGLHWFLASTLFFENGWRDASPSNVRQFFGKVGKQYSKSSLALTIGFANNSLAGNGLQEARFLDRSYSSIYTKPDITNNRSPFATLVVQHTFNSNLTASGNLYYRYIGTSTLNADLNENSFDQSVYQPNAQERAALTAAGYFGFPFSGASAANTPFPYWRCIAQGLLNDEPAEKCNAQLNRTRSLQRNFGGSGQVNWFGAPGGQRNQFAGGAGYDHSNLAFLQSTQLGYLNPDRSVTGISSFGDGITGGSIDGVPFDSRADLRGRIRTFSLYITDTLSVARVVSITASARYNRTQVENFDRIRPGGGSGSLDGNYTFARLNPAVGLAYNPYALLGLFFNFSEGSRAPTAIELGCADPARPCKLPNAMAGDPPLNQVVTRSFEAGIRGRFERKFDWNLAFFRGSNRDDILFVSSTQTGFGYFRNFGSTRRQGLEADINSSIWRVNLGVGYTLLDATYRSAETVNGSSNSTSDAIAKGLDGNIQILPGDRIPLIPRHTGKVFADYKVSARLTIDAGLIAVSSSYARGNENNRHAPDGNYYQGSGAAPGYAVVNLGGRYELSRHLQLFASVGNLLNRRYYTAAQLGATGFTDQQTYIARPYPAVNGEFPVQHTTFLAPGAPRGIWGGITFRF